MRFSFISNVRFIILLVDASLVAIAAVGSTLPEVAVAEVMNIVAVDVME